jgi:peroxiredoxin Q/BCP
MAKKKATVKSKAVRKAPAKKSSGTASAAKAKPAKKAAKKVVAPKKAAKPAKKAAVKVSAVKKAATKVTPKATVVKKSAPKKAAPAKATFKAHSTKLKAGDAAPHFKGHTQDGKEVSLTQLAGKKVVLYFYPKDDTPGCTAEACSLRDNYKFMQKAGYEVVGVSADDEKSHAKFAKKYNLPFPLLADTQHEVIKAYDVWGKKQFMGRVFDGLIRTTFVINEKGVIDEVITAVDTKNHADQILKK